MYSGSGYGEKAYSECSYSPPDTSAFEAFLAEIAAERVWLLELDVLSLAQVGVRSAAYSDSGYGELTYSGASGATSGTSVTLRFANRGYNSLGTDTPAYTHYEGRLLEETVDVDRQIAGSAGIGGMARVRATLSLINEDGALDTLLRDYSLAGRPARIKIGRPTDALAAFGTVYVGAVEEVEIARDVVRISLVGLDAKLERAVNETTYAGTGGLEGGADLKGQRKPDGWGKVYWIEPPLIDAANLIYQVRNGTIKDVTSVYDRGTPLVKVAGAPAAGQYQVDAAAGMFKLGAKPAGKVTCDAELDASGSGYISRTGDIVLRILATKAGLASNEIDPASFANLNTDKGADVGTWAGPEPRSCREVVDELLANAGCFGGFSRFGTYSVGVVAAASGSSKATYSAQDILEIERLPVPGPVNPIVWRSSVGYQKNYSPTSDLAAGVPDAQKTFAAQPVRLAVSEDAAIKSRHLAAVEYQRPSGLFANQADAAAEAQADFALWGTLRGHYRVTLPPKALTRDIGDVVDIQHPRFGLASGVSARVLRHQVRGPEVVLSVLV